MLQNIKVIDAEYEQADGVWHLKNRHEHAVNEQYYKNVVDAKGFFNELERDFDRLSQVLLEFYILQNLDEDAYYDACSEIAMETIWNYIEPVKTEETEETK